VIVGTDQGLADLDLATGIIKPASVASLKSQSSLITSVGRTPMGGLRATRSLNTALVLSQASCLELSQQDVFSENKPFEFDTALRKRQPLAESIFRIEAGTSPRESGSIQRPTEYAIVPPNYYVWSRKSGIILLNGATANITLHQYSNEIHLSSASLIASFATSNGTFGILDSSGLAVGTFVKSSRGGGSILCAIRPYGETHFRIGEEGGRLECPADRRDLELITSRPVSWGSTTISESILLPWSREVVSSRTGRASIIGNIPPGDHSMKILCQDRSVPLHVDLHVAAFVHETWWFRISMVAILLGLITGTVRWFVLLRIRRRELREREMIEERIHIGQDLHDSIGAELVRINIAAMQGPSAGQNTEIARLAREASRQLRDVVWSVSDIHTLDALIAVICERVRTIGDETGITVEIHTKGAIPSIDVSAQRLRDIYLIMTEAMTNIVRHSKSTSARLTSEWSEQQFTISIEDHGCGFDSSITTTGRGITGMIKRAERSQLSFQCHSTPGSGTRVSITMRLHHP
jgi:signal transduction histidine kinase